MPQFKLEIVTPDRAVLDEEVESLIVPAWEGYLGVLANHAPLLSVIRAGEVTVSKGSNVRRYAIAGGFLEVGNNRAILLADQIEPVESLNADAIAKQRDAVKAKIAAKEDVERNKEELEKLDQWSRLARKS
jgi:F-type H+-transporting ATPase subunit epsilon